MNIFDSRISPARCVNDQTVVSWVYRPRVFAQCGPEPPVCTSSKYKNTQTPRQTCARRCFSTPKHYASAALRLRAAHTSTVRLCALERNWPNRLPSHPSVNLLPSPTDLGNNLCVVWPNGSPTLASTLPPIKPPHLKRSANRPNYH